MTDFIFRPNKILDECPVCGIGFAHGHKQGDKPNVFFTVPENATHVPSDHLPKKEKSQSQTLRAVLFLRWEREVGGHRMSSEHFYSREMEKIIDHQKSLL